MNQFLAWLDNQVVAGLTSLEEVTSFPELFALADQYVKDPVLLAKFKNEPSKYLHPVLMEIGFQRSKK